MLGEALGAGGEVDRERGLDVLPFCPFVNSYVQHHREYVGLVPAAYRESFDL